MAFEMIRGRVRLLLVHPFNLQLISSSLRISSLRSSL